MHHAKIALEKAKKRYDELRDAFIMLSTQAIKEDRPFEKEPQTAKFSFPNPDTGKVFGRTRVEKPIVDMDELRGHPTLSAAVTEERVYSVDRKKLDKILTDNPELLPEFQEMVELEVSIKLSPVRDISPEDL